MTVLVDQLNATAGGVLWLVAELVVLFLVVAAGIAVAARRLGLHRLRRLLGGNRLAGAVKGIALGFLTPFCTYSAIPVLVAMIDSGVRTSAWVGFLLAAPVLDPLIAVALAVIFSPAVALAYTAAVFAGVLATALVADIIGVQARARQHSPSVHAAQRASAIESSGDMPCAPDPLTDHAAWRGWPAEACDAVGYAYRLLRGLAVPLAIAAVVAVAIAAVVPRDLIVAVAGTDNVLAVPVAALIGTPLYVSGEAFLPIAASLKQQGMGDGALFALIIAGAGVNLPELGVLAKLLQPRLVAALAGAIFAIAMLAGYIVPVVT